MSGCLTGILRFTSHRSHGANPKNQTLEFMIMQEQLSKYLLCLGVVASITLTVHAAETRRAPKRPHLDAGRTAEGGALSLDRAIRLALEHNPDLQASGARKDAASGRAVQARAWPRPHA